MTDAVFLHTIGHSTRSLEEFVSILRGFGIARIVDVRTVPCSRHNPQFDGDSLPAALTAAGIEYRHLKGLGGFRQPRPDSQNQGWRNPSFRGYADYMQTQDFEKALEELVHLAEERATAIMCAEAVPWRCHRSLIADALVARGHKVAHIMDREISRIHVLNPLAVVREGKVSYPDRSDGSPS
jgi:uncharacterized protein (DUF488 family)